MYIVTIDLCVVYFGRLWISTQNLLHFYILPHQFWSMHFTPCNCNNNEERIGYSRLEMKPKYLSRYPVQNCVDIYCVSLIAISWYPWNIAPNKTSEVFKKTQQFIIITQKLWHLKLAFLIIKFIVVSILHNTDHHLIVGWFILSNPAEPYPDRCLPHLPAFWQIAFHICQNKSC